MYYQCGVLDIHVNVKSCSLNDGDTYGATRLKQQISQKGDVTQPMSICNTR